MSIHPAFPSQTTAMCSSLKPGAPMAHRGVCAHVYQWRVSRLGHGRQTRRRKLLRYLYENHHSTPSSSGGLVIEVQAPIMVFRRVASASHAVVH